MEKVIKEVSFDNLFFEELPPVVQELLNKQILEDDGYRPNLISCPWCCGRGRLVYTSKVWTNQLRCEDCENIFTIEQAVVI